MASTRKTRAQRLVLVGGETLLGRDIQEVLNSRSPAPMITPYAANGEGNFAEEDGEAVFREPLELHSLDGEQAVLVAGSAVGAEKAYQLVKKAGGKPVLIDCTGQLENQPEARIAAPLLDGAAGDPSWLYVLAHPASTAVALALSRLARYKTIRQAVLTVFEPASERGKQGISELHQQTTSLLAFKPLEKKVFDAQLSFSLLPAYGEEAPDQLSAIEQRIERHLATLLSRTALSRTVAAQVPMPSLRLVQAPVFHGYSISAWIEFEGNVICSSLEEALASAQVDVRGAEHEVPTNVGIAGQSGLIAGDIRIDRNNGRAAWFWIVADNLRLAADSAAALIGQLEPVTP